VVDLDRVGTYSVAEHGCERVELRHPTRAVVDHRDLRTFVSKRHGTRRYP
jgi:hypothetical protein